MDNMVDSSSIKTRQNIAYITISIIIVFAIYFGVQVYNLFKKPINSAIVRDGTLTNFEETIAYVIREEEVLDTSSYLGERQNVILDTNKVSKGGTIAYYLSSDKTEEQLRLAEVEKDIQEILTGNQIPYSSDIKTIETNIANQLYKLVDYRDDVYGLAELKTNIDSDMQKKTSLVADLPGVDSNLKNLIKERNNLLEEIDDKKQSLKSDRSGIVSYRVDGYEDEFTTKSFSNLSINGLKKMNIVTNQLIPIDYNKVKIINNFYTYLAVITKSKEGKNLNLNDVVKISLNNDLSNYDRATVEYIVEGKDERLVVLKLTTNSEYLTQYRKINADLIWWNYEGLKVDDRAIYDKELLVDNMFISEETLADNLDKYRDTVSGDRYITLKAVKVQLATGYPREVFVKVENNSNGYSIISNYTDDELKKYGIPQEFIDNRYKIKTYDEVYLP